jgi:hypothetical protein
MTERVMRQSILQKKMVLQRMATFYVRPGPAKPTRSRLVLAKDIEMLKTVVFPIRQM